MSVSRAASPEPLGRSVVVEGAAVAPAAWAGAPEVVVDAQALTSAGVGERLHLAWRSREAVVIRLAVDPGRFRSPRSHEGEPWTFDAGFTPLDDLLQHVVWANSYDARADGDPVWWWGRKALRLGAGEIGPDAPAGDVVLSDGRPAWIDGGPRTQMRRVDVGGAVVVHRETVEAGGLGVAPEPVAPTATLAPDQLAAVAHEGGAARIVAPAGSGKTRVLTERLRHLIEDRGWEREAVLAVAFNVRARDELAQRTADFAPRVQTLNALGHRLLSEFRGAAPRVLDERDVRKVVDGIVTVRHRVGQDPISPYLEGLSRIRLGLRNPTDVEAEVGDVDGLADVLWPAYRGALRSAGGIDFDEQIYGTVEALLQDGDFRRWAQLRCRHLLVDEFQDLTPAHLLMIRLLAGPQADVFGVGDDDQVIYGYAGADPRFLVGYQRWFPGAIERALEVNYRCPVAVVSAVGDLLRHTTVRVAKEIRPGPDADPSPDALSLRPHASQDAAASVLETVRGWLGEGAAPGQVAVLARVGSMLLAPHVALHQAGIPLASELHPDVLSRPGTAAALAYLRLGNDPQRMSGADLVAVWRRPSRSLPQWFPDRVGRRGAWSPVLLAGIGDTMPERDRPKLSRLCDDLRLVSQGCRGTTRDALVAIRDGVGLGEAMDTLDASKGGQGGSNLDDLDALLQLAELHDDPATFEEWVRAQLAREADPHGVTLATVHRVKGQEWDRVVVFGATDGLMPHRLADDVEEERRICHVAVTRGRHRVVVLGDASRPSPFLAELAGEPSPLAGRRRAVTAVASARAGSSKAKASPDDRLPTDHPIVAAMRAWRSAKVADEHKPAYVYLTDATIDAIARRAPTNLAGLARVPGIGPAKLEAYGDQLVEVLGTVAAG